MSRNRSAIAPALLYLLAYMQSYRGNVTYLALPLSFGRVFPIYSNELGRLDETSI
jgi:hypothetical protein